ncbi:type 1 pili tip component [Litoribrevibacter euphylliae]|uniref:Type 1 pili tip component n=1 Tax=Litoribrevibacter euphylliae TaxID=1834034 RepID=A0ABV7HCP8_9GAMM
MKRLQSLLQEWQNHASQQMDDKEYSVKLSRQDAARINALADLYPKLDSEDIIRELLHIALDEVEASLPYVAGKKVVATDEEGDPIYEDSGLTPRYLQLTREHIKRLKQAANCPGA